jgi:hypothetical protein
MALGRRRRWKGRVLIADDISTSHTLKAVRIGAGRGRAK